MIEINEYVRTDNGEIHKVLDTEKGSIKIKSKYKEWIGLCCIKKHSNQLIDLIEVGDYVNGHRVVNEIWGEDDNNLYFEIEGGFNKAQYIGEKDIQTILTEESYMANCYKKVGGENEELTI